MLNESQVQSVIADVLDREGGYSNNAADRGGATNFGITQETANALGLGDVRSLSRTAASDAYAKLFAQWGITAIPDYPTFHLVADSCVQHGPGNAIKWLQSAIRADSDGNLGPVTIAAIHMVLRWDTVYYAILSARLRFYGQIIARNASQAMFAAGWLNRLSSFIYPAPKWTP